jgi:hypothetical protein
VDKEINKLLPEDGFEGTYLARAWVHHREDPSLSGPR